MKVCGFTFIRNAVKFDFPVAEAIASVLPLCNHFVVAVGKSDDATRELIRGIDTEKISIVDTRWDESLQKGGRVYAVETDKAFDAVPPEYDWCFYIQGDEVLHEQFIPAVKNAMQVNLPRREVEGLLFGYQHFYGTYQYVADSRKWYRKEIRIIRNDKSIRSYRDAQGFRKKGRKLRVVPVQADIYHYGWVRSPLFMQKKIDEVRKFYNGITEAEAIRIAGEHEFDYGRSYDALARFQGTHPRVMQERVARQNWNVQVDVNRIRMKPKYRLLHFIEKRTGVRLFEYRNYKLLKNPPQ